MYVCIEPRKVNIESPLICLISSPVFLARRVPDLVEGRGDRVVEPLASLLLLACNLLLVERQTKVREDIKSWSVW